MGHLSLCMYSEGTMKTLHFLTSMHPTQKPIKATMKRSESKQREKGRKIGKEKEIEVKIKVSI